MSLSMGAADGGEYQADAPMPFVMLAGFGGRAKSWCTPRGAAPSLHREPVTTMDGSKRQATSYSPVFSGSDSRADGGFEWQINIKHPRIAGFRNEPTVQSARSYVVVIGGAEAELTV
jgi:hypothetical protein